MSPQSLCSKGGNPSGGQKGHQGFTSKQIEKPDEIVLHQVTICPKCEKNLEVIAAEVIIKRQVFDILPMAVQVAEHQTEMKVCSNCQKRVVGMFPENISAPTQYGARIKAMAVYLNPQQLISEDRVQDVFNDMSGLSISTATIVKMGEKFAARVTALYRSSQRLS